jgi:hypothetical protein
MDDAARLRTRLASTRGVSAAVLIAAGLSLGGVGVAAPGSEGWSKGWAEHVLRTRLHAVTVVCLPLGVAKRANGSRTFGQFLCSYVEPDGSRYAIRLRPRTRTTWTTESIEQLQPQPTSPGEARHGGGQAHKR